MKYSTSGNYHKTMISLHQKYGPVVRFAPNDLLVYQISTSKCHFTNSRTETSHLLKQIKKFMVTLSKGKPCFSKGKPTILVRKPMLALFQQEIRLFIETSENLFLMHSVLKRFGYKRKWWSSIWTCSFLKYISVRTMRRDWTCQK